MRRFLLRKRVLIPLGSGVVLMLLAYFVLLPWVVRGRVEVVLRQLKLRDVSYRVTRATPWTSTIRDLDAGGGNRIGMLTVTYSVEGLWKRRVDKIGIHGLQLSAEVRDGAASFGPLDALLRSSPTSQASRSTVEALSDPGAPAVNEWPFRSVRIESAAVVIRTPQRTLTIPFTAAVKWPQLQVDSTPSAGAVLKIYAEMSNSDAGSMRFTGERLAGDDLSTLAHVFMPGAAVRLAGDVRVQGIVSYASGKTTIDITAIVTTSAESAEPATQLADANLTVGEGVFHLVGDVGVDATSLRLGAQDLTLSESAVSATASGVSADVTIVDLSPPSTPPAQVVRIAKVTASKLELSDGFVRFSLGRDGMLNVEETTWQFLGGEVSAKDVRIVPGQPIALTLAAKDVELRELLALLAKGKAAGDGKVNGQLPLIIAPNGEVTLGEGFAEAVAGGRLSVTDESTLNSVAGAATGTAGSVASRAQAQVRNDIVAAVKDFAFESLTARLKSEPDQGLVAYVRMKGKGRTGARQALDYDLRVTGLEELLRSLVGVHQTVTREAARQ